jgi:hypothetical protein
MPEAGRRRVDKAFHAAFAQERGARGAALLNPASVRRELERALSAATTLASYRDFLAAGRAHKAARRGASLEFERELAAQADGALQAARQLGAATLRSARHIRNAGRFDDALDSWLDALRATRTVRLRDVLADVFEDPTAREALEEAGLTQPIRTEISGALESVEFLASAKAGALRVEIPDGDGGNPHTVTIARDPRPGRPRNVADLLAQGRFDAITDALDKSRFAISDVVVPAAGPAPDREPSELLLTGSMMIVQRTARHRRGLQDAGLALHEGRDPGTAGVILVAAAVLAVAAFALALMCGEGNETACTVGAILFGLALLLMAGAVCLSQPRPVDDGDSDPESALLCGMAVGTAFSFILGSID